MIKFKFGTSGVTDSFIKITILGDITCDRPLLEASRVALRKYNFFNIFLKIKPFLSCSDFICANFETVCAGSNNDFQNEYFLYNTPDDIVPAMKEAGIDYVMTANNHCLDQGIEGLKRTIEVLNKFGVGHTGTFASPGDRVIEKQIVDVAGIRIAVLAYTAGTNESNTGVVLNDTNEYLVGLLRHQKDNAMQAGGVKGFLAKQVNAGQRRTLKRIVNRTKLKLGISYFRPYTDVITPADTPENPYLIKVKEEIAEAKKVADLVVVAPHMGGQFNTVPGTYSEFLVDYLKSCGADIIAGNHPHVIQKVWIDKSCVAAYSIGSFNLSLSADYIIHESLPEYSMALHVYVDADTKRIDHASFSILRIVEDKNHLITVYPIHQLPAELMTNDIKSNITTIYNRITGKNVQEIELRDEYQL